MATSIVRGRKCLLLSRKLFKQTIRSSQAGPYGPYFVLIPEVPVDSPETNPIMQYNDFPKFSLMKPDNILTGGAKLALDFDVKFGQHEEKLKDPAYKKTFDSVFLPIEEISLPLDYAYQHIVLLRYVMGSDHFEKVLQRIHGQVSRVKNERWISETLNSAIKELSADSDNLTEYQKRLVEIYLNMGKKSGIGRKGVDYKKMVEQFNIVQRQEFAFRQRVEVCEHMFSQDLHNFNVIKDMPMHVIAALSTDKLSPTRGPWKLTIKEPMYNWLMSFCNDRMTRWNIWHARNNRASHLHASSWIDNIESLEKIRMYRDDIGKNLGFENYVEYVMEERMAGSLKTVLNMMDTLKVNYYSVAEAELNTLQQFAEADGFPHNLQMWDIPYYRRKHFNHVYRLGTDISEHFPLPKVLNGLFDLSTRLFGVTFKQQFDCDTYHPDVIVYDVFDEGQCVGTFFMDPYAREGKGVGQYCLVGRDKCDSLKITPIVYMMLNYNAPYLKSDPCLLSFQEVRQLFYLFGDMLRHVLSKVPYKELASHRFMELDAKDICPKFMTEWLTVPEIVQEISGHFETGAKLPDHLIERVLEGQKHMFAFDLMHECYRCAYDFEIHLGDLDWDDTMRKVWEVYMPVELDKEDRHPTAFNEIFGDVYGAGYYSHLWASMVAKDIFDAFKEAGLGNKDKVSAVGKRFKDTFYAHSAAIGGKEVFRQFRGRDPSIQALLSYYNSSLPEENVYKIADKSTTNAGLDIDPVTSR